MQIMQKAASPQGGTDAAPYAAAAEEEGDEEEEEEEEEEEARLFSERDAFSTQTASPNGQSMQVLDVCLLY
jgi:hypothetical protein